MMMFNEYLIVCLFMLATLEQCWAEDAKLLFSRRNNEVYIMTLPSFAKNETTEVPTKPVNFTGMYPSMACDARKNELVWTAEPPRKNGQFRIALPTGERKLYKASFDNLGTVTELVDTGLEFLGGMAYDWITGNVYLIELSRIMVCGGGSSQCSILLKINRGDGDIALEPNQGVMFWIQRGEPSAIMRAGMDGSSPKPIVSLPDNFWSAGICVDMQPDVQKRRIFFIQGGNVESIRMDGSDRRTVLTEKSVHYFTWIGVFRDRVFWSDENTFTIASADKDTGLNKTILHKAYKDSDSDSYESPYGLVICHPDNQPIYRLDNPCADSGCSHICTLSFESGYRCFCPEGMNSDGGEMDGKNCTDSPTTWSYLYVADQGEIKFARLPSIGKIIFESVTIPELDSISAITYNPTKTNSLILSDSDQKKIFEYDMSTTKLEILVTDNISEIMDMEVDPIGENLYWADAGKQTVEVVSLRTKARAVLITGVKNPINIVVVPELGEIFISRMGRHGGSIFKYLMNGASSTFQFVHDRNPIVLTHENDRIYWINQFKRTTSLTLLWNWTTSETSIPLDGPISDAIILGSNVYWLDSSSRELKQSWGNSTKVLIGDLGGDSRIAVSRNTRSALQALLSNHKCSWKNPHRKNCSHICLLTTYGNGAECRCPEESHLGADGLTCTEATENVFSEEVTTLVVVLSVVTTLLIIVLTAFLLVGYWLYRNNAIQGHVHLQGNKAVICVGNTNLVKDEEDNL